MKKTILLVIFSQICFTLYAGLVQWSVNEGGNGHWYEVISEKVTWESAQTIALSRGGYLTTITSTEENQFVFSLINSTDYWWYSSYGNWEGPWIGGIQGEGAEEPDGGWMWITGENFVYTAWAPGQPNNAVDNQDRIHFWNSDSLQPTWQDVPNSALNCFIIEYEYIPEPCTVLLLGLGGLLISRR